MKPDKDDGDDDLSFEDIYRFGERGFISSAAKFLNFLDRHIGGESEDSESTDDVPYEYDTPGSDQDEKDNLSELEDQNESEFHIDGEGETAISEAGQDVGFDAGDADLEFDLADYDFDFDPGDYDLDFDIGDYDGGESGDGGE